jgi:hypothetical protein
MKHASLMIAFINDSTLLIKNWNNGYYNIIGFKIAKKDVESLFLINFFFINYDKKKSDISSIRVLTNNVNENIIDLSYFSFKRMKEDYETNFTVLKFISESLNNKFK